MSLIMVGDCVTPLVGVWIEIFCTNSITSLMLPSLPLWECGLKFYVVDLDLHTVWVTPLVGVWIEILC